MKELQIRYSAYGEWWKIWNTNETDLEKAYAEIDCELKPECGAWIRFKNDDKFIIVNGGF